jgi:hypothetical protein
VGGTCGKHKRGMCTRFWWESLKEREYSEDRGVDGLDHNGFSVIGWRLEWIQLTKNRGRWWAVVNTVMNLLDLAPRS